MTTRNQSRRAAPEPALLRRLRAHFRADPARLPVVEQVFEGYDRPNLYLAIEECLAEPGRRAELFGVVGQDDYHPPSLARLARPRRA